MFTLITATPGAGKTLWVINQLHKINDRQIFYHGINELSESLKWHLLDDDKVKNFNEHVPDGSIVVIDECVDFFPVRPPSSKPPEAIEFLRKHRHRGFDIYFITQHPLLLDHSARRLVGEHVHLQRNFGMNRSVCYRGNKLIDTTNYFDLKNSEKTNFSFPKEIFKLYKSAEIHTHKRRIPKLIFLLIPLIGAVILGMYTLFNILGNATSGDQNKDITEIIRGNEGGIINQGEKKIPTTIEGWHKAFKTLVIGMPFTAPIYQKKLRVQKFPSITACFKDIYVCKCYTQQGSIIETDKKQCVRYVESMPFNPFIRTAKNEKNIKQNNNNK